MTASEHAGGGGTGIVESGPVVYEATIERIRQHSAPDTRSLFLRLQGGRRLAFQPGQFISCRLPIGAEPIIRPYSIASDPEDPQLLEICLNLVPGGPGSTYLFALNPGVMIRFTGPWGTFALERQPEAECIFIADGTGIAPIRPMLKRALAASSQYPVRLHYAAKSIQHLLYTEELQDMARRQRRFAWDSVVDRPLTNFIDQRYVGRDADRTRHFYICGVGEIVHQLRDLLRRAGYERRAVHYEKW